MARDVTVGGILGETLALLGDGARDVAIYTAIVGGVSLAAIPLGVVSDQADQLSWGFMVDLNNGPVASAHGLVAAIVSLVAGYWLLTRLLAVRGRFQPGVNRFWPYLGMVILSGLATILGFILLIVPGVILMIRWSSASGFLIGEGQGVEQSLRSSWEATRGHSWTLFGAGLIVILGVLAVAGTVGGFAGVLGATVGEAVAAIVEAATNTVTTALTIAIYVLVHDQSGELGEVFA